MMRLLAYLLPLLLLAPAMPAAPQGTCADPLAATYCTEADVPDPEFSCNRDGDVWSCWAWTSFDVEGYGPSVGATEVTDAYLSIFACNGFSCSEERQSLDGECTWALAGGCSVSVYGDMGASGFLNGRCMEFFAEVVLVQSAGPAVGVPLTSMMQAAGTETISLGC